MPAIILDQMHWAQLEQVQQVVNQRVTPESDAQRFGVKEYWEPAGRSGDCEDIALAKRARLIEMGWPADNLRIAVVINERREMHAVPTVDVTSQKGDARHLCDGQPHRPCGAVEKPGRARLPVPGAVQARVGGVGEPGSQDAGPDPAVRQVQHRGGVTSAGGT